MAQPFIGQISCFGCNFAPRYWAFCRGQILSIAQNQALFAIIGTFYGGNGTSTFALPNFQGYAPMHWGTTGGLPTTVIGEIQGSTQVTLMSMQIPAHQHTAVAAAVSGSGATQSAIPSSSAYLSEVTAGDLVYDTTSPVLGLPFGAQAISPNGGNMPHDNMQPYLALNLCIAVEGVFPSRN
ncbi:MAG TPA: tail fiber protein [Pseudolabrys sp.]|nr:tail fiber protein [Pseudolabrys sp.]